MTEATYSALKGELLAKADSIQAAKQPSYTRGTGNVLHNFESAAQAACITPEQAWVCHAKKQWDAIAAIMVQPNLIQAEPPIERFADLMNYLKLGYAMWSQHQRPDSANTGVTVEHWRSTPTAPEGQVAELRQTFQR